MEWGDLITPALPPDHLVVRIDPGDADTERVLDFSFHGARWLARHNYKSVRLITSDWHMRRARYEFEKVLRGKYALTTDAVRTEPTFVTLFAEYNKYLLRRLAVWADL